MCDGLCQASRRFSDRCVTHVPAPAPMHKIDPNPNSSLSTHHPASLAQCYEYSLTECLRSCISKQTIVARCCMGRRRQCSAVTRPLALSNPCFSKINPDPKMTPNPLIFHHTYKACSLRFYSLFLSFPEQHLSLKPIAES